MDRIETTLRGVQKKINRAKSELGPEEFLGLLQQLQSDIEQTIGLLQEHAA